MPAENTPLQLVVEIVGAGPPGGPRDVDIYELGRRDYRVRIDGGFAPAVLDWDPDLLADLAALRKSAGDPEVLGRLGARLRQFLRDTDWPRYEADLLAALERRTPVHITVRSDADEMYALPWDLLPLDSSGQHIGELPGVLTRYAWPRSRPPTSAETPNAGRILLAWSAAAGPVPVAAQVQALRRACGRRSSLFDEQRDVLAHVSWGRLQDALQHAADTGRPVQALHILCHGVRRGRSLCLAWNDDDGDGLAVIDAIRLRRLLAEYTPGLQLVVLCACDSSNEALLGTHLGSLARTLHRVGIQAVIGSAVPLSTRGSITFTERFYHALIAERAAPAQAFLAARRRLAGHVRTLDWLALRFYCRPEGAPGPPPNAPAHPRRTRRWIGWRSTLLVAAFIAACLGTLAMTLSTEIPLKPGPRPVHRAAVEGFLFELEGCRRVAENAVCAMRITNQDRSRRLYLYTKFKQAKSLLYDDANRTIRATRATLAGENQHFGSVGGPLLTDYPAKATIQFDGLSPHAKRIARIELVLGVGKRKPSTKVEFRDVALVQ